MYVFKYAISFKRGPTRPKVVVTMALHRPYVPSAIYGTDDPWPSVAVGFVGLLWAVGSVGLLSAVRSMAFHGPTDPWAFRSMGLLWAVGSMGLLRAVSSMGLVRAI